ncbi:Histone demethylase UTY, partial [Plecturocebus cupreus]
MSINVYTNRRGTSVCTPTEGEHQCAHQQKVNIGVHTNRRSRIYDVAMNTVIPDSLAVVIAVTIITWVLRAHTLAPGAAMSFLGSTPTGPPMVPVSGHLGNQAAQQEVGGGERAHRGSLLKVAVVAVPTKAHVIAQAGVQWCGLSSLKPLPPGFKDGVHHVGQAGLKFLISKYLPALAFQNAGITCMSDQTGFLPVGQAGLELPTAGDMPILASQSAEITDRRNPAALTPEASRTSEKIGAEELCAGDQKKKTEAEHEFKEENKNESKTPS